MFSAQPLPGVVLPEEVGGAVDLLVALRAVAREDEVQRRADKRRERVRIMVAETSVRSA